MRLSIAGTGHRPPRLGLSYSNEDNVKLTNFAIDALKKFEIEQVVSGMAQGWDQALAEAAIYLKIPLVCAFPFYGMGDTWPKEAKLRRNRIINKASTVHYVSKKGYEEAGNDAYFERDKWMIDYVIKSVGVLLTLWDGNQNGGTYYTIKYANKKGLAIKHCWSDWKTWVIKYEQANVELDHGTPSLGDFSR